MADLKDIELARVGEFELSTGKQRFTPEMLADAARRAAEAGAKFRAPLKLGHTDPRNDGEPAFGWLHNVRVEAGVLLGDATGVPTWLAENAKTAYPDRSIEANAIGKDGTEGMELTGLALLGQTPPGISTLQSWRELPTLIAAAAEMPIQSFAVAYAAIRDTPQTPAAEPVTPINPKEADLMSDTLIKGLREQLGIADDATLDEAGLLTANAEALKEKADPPAVTPELIAASLKLDVEKVKTALAAAAGAPAPTVVPDGKKLVDADQWEDMKIAASAGAEARAVQLKAERDDVIEHAYRAGKISAAAKPKWVKRWDVDADTAREDIAGLEAVFPVQASGAPGGEEIAASAITDDDIKQLAAMTGLSEEDLRV